MVSHKTHPKQSSSDSESDSSTIIPFPIQKFVMEPSVPMSMDPPDTASLTAMPEGWTPQVIPTNTDWRQDPRWQSLRGDVTPKQISIPEDTLVPNPSPAKSALSVDSESDGGSSPSTPTGSFIHQRRRRRGEYHHRPPVWIIQPFTAPDDSQQVSQHESGRGFSSLPGGSRALHDPFGLNLGQLAYNNQLTAMTSNVNIDPFVVGMVQESNDREENNRNTTHQLPLPTPQSPFEVSQFSSDSASVSSAEYSCVPSTTPCERCPELVVCEHCGRCENCLGEIQRCPNWMQSKHRQLFGNESKGQKSKPEDSNGKKAVRSLPLTDSMPKTYIGPSPPLREFSNMATKDENRKLRIQTTNLADTDAITPAPAHGSSQDMLGSEEKIRIGEIITKLPKDLSDQANHLIRKSMPDAKSHYNTAMDVARLPEEILISLQEWLSVTANSSNNTHQNVHSSSNDINDSCSPTLDENGPRCVARCKDLRVRSGAYAIEAGSQVICVGCTEAPMAKEGEFTFQKGQVFTVIQVFGDHWAACIKGTLQGAFEDEDVVRLETIHGEKYCVVRRDNANLGFLPLCAVTLISNYAEFLADVNGAEKETKPWNGLTLSAPKRVQSLNAQHEWANFVEVTVPRSHWTMHKASAIMKDVTRETEPFDEGIDERKLNPCLFYQRDPDCDKESFGEPTTLTRKAARRFQKARVLLSRGDERDAVEKRLKRLPLQVVGSGEKDKPELPGVPNAGLGDLPSPRDSQIGPISQSEQPPADGMLLRDPGNLLSGDPGARYRHAEGPHWWMVNPRAMSMDEPRTLRAVETASWGRVIGRRMATTVSSGGQSLSRGLRRMTSWRPGASEVRPTVATPSEPRTPLSPSTIPELWRRPHSRMTGKGAGRMPAMAGGGASLPMIVSPDNFVRTPVSDRDEEGPPQDGLEDVEPDSGECESGAHH